MARPTRICATPGCPSSTTATYCTDHELPSWQTNRHRRLRPSSAEWSRICRTVAARDRGRCHECGKMGATVFDHVRPLSEDGTNDISNVAMIHEEPCHRRKTEAERRRGLQRSLDARG